MGKRRNIYRENLLWKENPLYRIIILNIYYRLVCSGIKGHIISFIDYLEALYVKKGLFDYVFCIGDFFGDDNCEAEWNQFKKSGKISKENQFFV